MLGNSTEWVYYPAESICAGLGANFQSISGFTLNLLVVLALLRTPSLRKDYLTLFILSLAATDLIYSTVTLPIIAARNFAGKDWFMHHNDNFLTTIHCEVFCFFMDFYHHFTSVRTSFGGAEGEPFSAYHPSPSRVLHIVVRLRFPSWNRTPLADELPRDHCCSGMWVSGLSSPLSSG